MGCEPRRPCVPEIAWLENLAICSKSTSWRGRTLTQGCSIRVRRRPRRTSLSEVRSKATIHSNQLQTKNLLSLFFQQYYRGNQPAAA